MTERSHLQHELDVIARGQGVDDVMSTPVACHFFEHLLDDLLSELLVFHLIVCKAEVCVFFGLFLCGLSSLELL